MHTRHHPAATLIAATAVALACLGTATSVGAALPDRSRIGDATLQQRFWDCDAHATEHGLSASDGAVCASLGDALKARLFGGDFDRLFAWWRAHRSIEYARRGVALPAAAATDAGDAALQTP